MEVILTLLVVVLFILHLALRSRVNTLSSEINTVRAALAAQAAQLQSLIGSESAVHTVAAAEIGSPVVAGSAPDRAPTTTPPAEVAAAGAPPAETLTSVRDVLAEAVPALAAASAAAKLARRQRQGPPLMERWVKRFRGTEEWEALIGGRLLNRIGAVALILGVAFFFKYAIDQNWIGQGVRVAIGLLVGAGLLAVAYRAHRRGYPIFGQGLVGAGLGVLYLSVYASFNFYHLAPQPVALAGMLVISAAALVQGLYYDSIAVSLLACLGGYATPFLLSSGGDPAGTVACVLLLDAGVLALADRRRRWLVLPPIALVMTYATYFSWYLTSYHSSQLVLGGIALSLFWAVFLAFELRTTLVATSASPWLDHVLGAANGVAYYGALLALVGPHHRGWMVLLTLAIGAVYLGALLLARRRHDPSSSVVARYTLSAMVLLAVATVIQFRGFTVVTLWSLEALPLVWFGARRKLWYVWRPALILYALAIGLLFATPGALAARSVAHFLPVLNQRALAFLVLAAVLAASTIPISRLHRDRGEAIAVSLQWAWMVLVFILLAVEAFDLFRRLAVGASPQTTASLELDRSLVIAALWMAYSLALHWAGVTKRVSAWLEAGLGAAAMATLLGGVVGAAYEPIQRFTPVLNVRVAALLLLAGGLALHLRLLRREDDTFVWRKVLRPALQITILLLGFELVSAEVNDYFRHRLGHDLLSMDAGAAFIELAILASFWMLYSLFPTWLGVQKRTMPLIVTGLSMAAAATGVAAIGSIALQPSHQLALLLGVRPVILIILVAGLSMQLRWLREKAAAYQWTGNVAIAIQAAILLLGFGLISAETRDAFAQAITGASSQHAATLRNLEKLTFSLVWLVYAMVVLGVGIWRRALWMRVGAMALFAFTILKVFIYDLSFLSAVYRPISFVGLGLTLLAVSFLYQRYRSALFSTA